MYACIYRAKVKCEKDIMREGKGKAKTHTHTHTHTHTSFISFCSALGTKGASVSTRLVSSGCVT